MGENKHTGTAMGSTLGQGYMMMPEERAFLRESHPQEDRGFRTQLGVSVGKRQVHFSHGDRS